MRPLRKSDYGAGILDVLRVLTSVGDVSRERWEGRFEYMRSCGRGLGGAEEGVELGGEEEYGMYFVLVVCEEGGRVVGTGAVIVERKL